MKMGLFSAGFWGVFLIVLGVALVVKYVFNVNFPVGRIMISVLLIYIGVVLLLGKPFGNRDGNKVIFAEDNVQYIPGQSKYECLFGKATLDLSGVRLERDENIKISCAFGEYIVLLNPETPVVISSSSAFGSFTGPGNRNFSFGNDTFDNRGQDAGQPKLSIRAEVAFGSMVVKYKQ